MAENDPPFGTGIGLSSDFDLQTDSTGDLETVSGTDELEKDLSLLVAFRAKNIIGLTFSPEDKARVRVRTRKTLLEDPRVMDVSYVEVKQDPEDSDKAIVGTQILTITGQLVSFEAEV